MRPLSYYKWKLDVFLHKKLYACFWCEGNRECEYAFDPYNKEKTVEDAKNPNTVCLGLK